MPRNSKAGQYIPTESHDATRQARQQQAWDPRGRRARGHGLQRPDLFERSAGIGTVLGMGPHQVSGRPLRVTPQGSFALVTLALASRLGASDARPAPLADLTPAPWAPPAFVPAGAAATVVAPAGTTASVSSTSAVGRSAGPSALAQTVSIQSLAAAPRGFVRTNGTQFSLDGKPWYFGGTNAFSLAMTDQYTEDQVRSILKAHADNGARVVRFFAFSNGDGAGDIPISNPIQPTPGTFQEGPLQRMDLLLSEAAKNDLRVVMPLANFEDQLGGMQWYVNQIVGAGSAKESFYTDDRVRTAYKNYATMLVNRVNTLTGVRYGDDPTILSWELSNEPHTTNLYERNLGLPQGKIVRDWAIEMSAHIKGLGVQQLISTGEEGYRADGDASPPNNDWINGGFKGVDFVGNTALENISFATVHVYPDNWAIPASDYSWVDPNFITDRANIAHAVNKPIIMEECGMKLGYLPQRDTLLQFFSDAAVRNNYAGLMVWQVSPANTGTQDYNFGYGEQGGDEMIKIYDVMRNRS